MSVSSAPSDEIVVRESPAVWAAVWAGFPLLGAGAAWGLLAIAGWVTDLPWAPMQGPFELMERFAGPPLTIGALVAGAIAGLVLAVTGAGERLTVTVRAAEVRLLRDDTTTPVERRQIAAAFVDGKELVLQSGAGEELAREKSDLPAAVLAAAFRAHGYPWRDGDPHAAEFRPWVDGGDGLPPGANAVLKARDRALEKNEKEHVAELRAELARLGVVVRDDKKRQSWRPLSR